MRDKDVWSSSSEKSRNGMRNLEVRFDGAASHWTDALPIGNGRLGAMIWGGIANETINLNGNSCFLSTPLMFSVAVLMLRGRERESTLSI